MQRYWSQPSFGPDSRVNADLVNLGGIVANVLDMAKDVTLAVLTQGVSENGADTEVDSGRLFNTPLNDRKPLDDGNTTTIDDLVAEVVQELVSLWCKSPGFLSSAISQHQTRAHLRDLSQRLASLLECLVRVLKLGNELWSPVEFPERVVGQELLPLPDSTPFDLLGELLVWDDFLEDRLMLA